MNLLKCDKCGNRNVMCSLCEKNRLYRETEYSHDNFIRNKAIDEFVREMKKNYPLAENDLFTINDTLHRTLDKLAEQLKRGDA